MGTPNRGAPIRWGPTVPLAGRRGPVRSRRGSWQPLGCRWGPGGPYLSRTPIQDSRVILQGLMGPVVPNQGSNGNPTEPRLWPIWPDGPRRALTDDSMDPYGCTTNIRTHTGPLGTPTSPDGTQRDPSDFNP